MDNHRLWTKEQDRLRGLITARDQLEEAIQLFLSQHAAVHTAAISDGRAWSLHDEALAGLSDDQVKACSPKQVNSIAWLLWHITRIEDMTINYLVYEKPQILVGADWQARLGVDLWDCGTGMTPEQVAEFSASISLPDLLAYRAEVGRSTRAGATSLGVAELKSVVPDSAIQQLVAEGSISDQAPGLAEFYTARKKGFFLIRTATSHNFHHLRQVERIAAEFRG